MKAPISKRNIDFKKGRIQRGEKKKKKKREIEK